MLHDHKWLQSTTIIYSFSTVLFSSVMIELIDEVRNPQRSSSMASTLAAESLALASVIVRPTEEKSLRLSRTRRDAKDYREIYKKIPRA